MRLLTPKSWLMALQAETRLFAEWDKPRRGKFAVPHMYEIIVAISIYDFQYRDMNDFMKNKSHWNFLMLAGGMEQLPGNCQGYQSVSSAKVPFCRGLLHGINCKLGFEWLNYGPINSIRCLFVRAGLNLRKRSILRLMPNCTAGMRNEIFLESILWDVGNQGNGQIEHALIRLLWKLCFCSPRWFVMIYASYSYPWLMYCYTLQPIFWIPDHCIEPSAVLQVLLAIIKVSSPPSSTKLAYIGHTATQHNPNYNSNYHILRTIVFSS